MTNRQTEAMGFVGALLLLFAFMWWGVVQGNAQQLEKARTQTANSWGVTVLPEIWLPSSEGYFRKVRVDVIDAGSVCIYVTRPNVEGNPRGSHTTNVVPKSQLPQGRGCQ